jgi:undecaprenyl-diphosphatase
VPVTRVLVLGWLVALVACLAAFAAISVVALAPGVPLFDRSMTAQFHELASPTLDMVMLSITGLGSTLVLAVLVGLLMVALAARGRRAEALFAAAALAGTLALNEALKWLLARPRPGLDWAESATGFGFPSGHAMNSTVVFGAVALVAWRLWGPRVGVVALTLSLTLAVLVGASRIYLGVHWATDVVGGFLAGALLLLVISGAFALTRPGPSTDG